MVGYKIIVSCTFCTQRLAHGQYNIEGSALTWLAPGINQAVVLIHYFFGYSQANTRAFIFYLGIEPLKNSKDLVAVLLIKSDSIVCNGDLAKAA